MRRKSMLSEEEKLQRGLMTVRKRVAGVLNYHLNGETETTSNGTPYEHLSEDRIEWLRGRIARMGPEDFLQFGQIVGRFIWNAWNDLHPNKRNAIRCALGAEFHILVQLGVFPEIEVYKLTERSTTLFYIRKQPSEPLPKSETKPNNKKHFRKSTRATQSTR